MLWIIITVAALVLITWRFYIQPYKYWKSMGVPQLHPWIFFGDSWTTLFRQKHFLDWIEWIYYMHPKSRYVGMYQFYMRTLFVRDPELIKQLTIKDFDYFTDHNSLLIDEKMDALWSKNLFSLKGEKWRDMRSLLSGSFRSSKIKIVYDLISKESKKFANYFLKQDKPLIHVELKDAFTKYTNDVIATTAFGIEVDSLENPNNEFFQMGKTVTNLNRISLMLKVIGLMACPWIFRFFGIGILPKRSNAFFVKSINETIKAREEQGIVRPDMINLLLEVKNGSQKSQENVIPDTEFAVVQESSETAKSHKKHFEVTNADIASQAHIFYLAGFDTVSTALCFSCYELAINPDIQSKLREEIDDIYQKSNSEPTYEDILEMRYMDMVVTESLRKWPAPPVVDRVCVKPYTLKPSNPEEPTITIKQNDSLWIPIYNIHHDPQYYPDPEKFIPERFSEENKRYIKSGTYLPFGSGPRACIGSRFGLVEFKLLLFYLLHHFEIVPTEKTQIPIKFSKSATNFIPEGGFQLAFKRV